MGANNCADNQQVNLYLNKRGRGSYHVAEEHFAKVRSVDSRLGFGIS